MTDDKPLKNRRAGLPLIWLLIAFGLALTGGLIVTDTFDPPTAVEKNSQVKPEGENPQTSPDGDYSIGREAGPYR